MAVLINALHNSPISRGEYFQIRIVSSYRHFFSFLLSFFFYLSLYRDFHFPIESKNACRGGGRGQGKFNLKNLVLNYAFADGIFHREIDFTRSFPVSLLEPPSSPPSALRHSSAASFVPQLRNSSKVSLEKGYILTFIFFETIVIERTGNSNRTKSSKPDLTNKRFLVLPPLL